jgi:hypothetical protein
MFHISAANSRRGAIIMTGRAPAACGKP